MATILSKVTKGPIKGRPIRAILYGAEGVGKSTFAAQAPNPIFLCAEDGTAQLDVSRLPEPVTFQDVVDSINALHMDDHDYKTLVIDTLDWLEPLVWRETCRMGGKKSIEDFGYGKGYVFALEIWRDLILQINAMCNKRNMHLIALAHAAPKKVDDPLTQAYDQQTLKIHDKATGLWVESVDAVLYTRVQVFTSVDERTRKHRAFGDGSRVVYTTPTAGYRAKNRYGLADQIPLDWSVIENTVKAGSGVDQSSVRAELVELLPKISPELQAKLQKFLDGSPSTSALLQTLDRTRTYAATQVKQ